MAPPRKILVPYMPLGGACMSLVLLAASASAQTNSWTYTGSSAGGWQTSGNWSDGVPDSGTHALFGETPTDGSIITFFNFDAAPNDFRDVGAISLVAGATQGRTFRGNTGTTLGNGELRIHGFETTIDSSPVILLIANHAADQTLLFTQAANTVQSVSLYQSGVIHTVGQITLTNPITDDGNGRSITKTGEGLLRMSNQSGGTTAVSTYSGGFILEQGIVEWVSSGSADPHATPFGTGPLTLRGGSLRSSSTGGRTIFNSVVIDGDVGLGSDVEDRTGSITVSSSLPGAVTTLTGDHTLTISTPGTVTWQQDISGAHRITKDGQGQLTFLSTATNSFSSLTVKEGIAQFGSGSSMPTAPDTVQEDHLVLDGGTLQFTAFGSTLLSTRGIQITPAGGTLNVLGGWLMGMNGPMTDANPENPGTFTKSGTGTWTFSSLSTPTHSGPTTVAEGRLVVNTVLPNSAVEVLDGARLGGNGTFGQPLTVRSGGELFVGARTEVGTTTAMAAVLLEAGSFLTYRLQGTDAFDQLQIHDSLTLDGVEMLFTLDYQPSVNDTFVLVSNLGIGSIVGTVMLDGSPLTDGSTFQLTGALLDPDTSDVIETYLQDFQIFYNHADSNSLAIVAVPEPATWATLAGLLTLGLAVGRRLRPATRSTGQNRTC